MPFGPRRRASALGERADASPVSFHGKHFDVDGFLQSRGSPQGGPLKVQVGASDTGEELAARTADVVFAASGHSTRLASIMWT
jgi:alkanesulfonate monooxygenase SsuD/methylene tetrahydromethanopterin reductase-like flavin-dependent oxidoreductase (luciferase family)